MDVTTTTPSAVPNKPKKREDDESQKPESTSMTISVEDTAVIPQVQNEYNRHFGSVLITLAVLSIFFPVILWNLLGSDEQYNIPLRTCLSMDTTSTSGPPRYHYQPGTMDHVTLADSNDDHEPWLGREGDGVSSCRMMTMSNVGSNYMHRLLLSLVWGYEHHTCNTLGQHVDCIKAAEEEPSVDLQLTQ